MKHIYFIDPLSKLNIKKDSTLMMAITSKPVFEETYLLFENDFYVDNISGDNTLSVYNFEGNLKNDGFYIESLNLLTSKNIEIDSNTVIHMRIDPPFDVRYQRYLWMLDYISHKTGCRVVNNPIGIMKHNEKLAGFKTKNAVESYVGSSLNGFKKFINRQMSKGVQNIILKPLDLYSGIGVRKFLLAGIW